MPQFAWDSHRSSRCAIPASAWDVLAFLARWALGLGFLSLAVGLLVHAAPATSQPLPWVSLGTMIVIVWWVIVSVGFYFYLTDLASYGSVFGSLASVIVVIAYLYISTTAFLFGAQLDAIIRAQFHRNTVRRGIGPFAPALGRTGVCLGRRSVVARVRVEHGARCSQSPGSLGPACYVTWAIADRIVTGRCSSGQESIVTPLA